MHADRPLNNFIQQFIEVIRNYDDALQFIREHRIWEGFFKHGWIAKLSLVAALVISVQFISIVVSWFTQHPENASVMQATSGLMSNIFESGKKLFMGNGAKYLLLIFLEILTFHCSVKTLNILLNEDYRPKLSDFVDAEKRMIAVAIRSWIYESIASVLIGVALGIIGFEFLKEGLVFVVSCYFIGFAFLDNYNEQFKVSLKQSSKIIRRFAGASIAIGLVSYLLMMIPLAGLVLGPVFGSVIAAMYFYHQGINMSEDRLAARDFVASHSTRPLK